MIILGAVKIEWIPWADQKKRRELQKRIRAFKNKWHKASLMCAIQGHVPGVIEDVCINEGFYDYEQWQETKCKHCGKRYEV